MLFNLARRLKINLWLALLYWTMGRLSIMLAPEPSYATGIWPPAGIALVAVLCGGYRYLPGIFLGAAVLNFGFLADTLATPQVGTSLGLAALIGAGSTLQAAVAAWLVTRFVGRPVELRTPRAIVRFLTLSGPVASLIAASVATVALYGNGAFGREPIGVHWFTWWLGDTVGAILFGLLGLCLVGEPRKIWRPRLTSVGLPLVLACAPVVIAQVGTSFLLSQRHDAEFRHTGADIASQLESDIGHGSRTLDLLASLFEGSEHVTRAEFERIASRQIGPESNLRWVAWQPADSAETGYRLPADDAVPDLSGYLLPERPAPGDRRLYLPAGTDGDTAALLATAVGRDGTDGRLLAALDLSRISTDALPPETAGMLNVTLRTNGGPGRTVRLLRQTPGQRPDPFLWQGNIELHGHTWHLEVAGLPSSYSGDWMAHALVTAAAGVIYSLALALLLLSDSSRQNHAERILTRIAARPGTVHH
ncbi:sensory box/GGDEF domain protein [Salinisphaera sp. PC39]|uniref:MASE1 domain-containing protein n=1 Tax=Salinisphaera sp. PC39 TaxID=1304156 RepID=UPI00333FD5DE